MIDCARCHVPFTRDECYDMQGSETTCPSCGVTLVVDEVETIRVLHWTTTAHIWWREFCYTWFRIGCEVKRVAEREAAKGASVVKVDVVNTPVAPDDIVWISSR